MDAVSISESVAHSAMTDTDAGGAPNADWGEGKLDVAMSVAGLPACTDSCLYDSDCGGGYKTDATDLTLAPEMRLVIGGIGDLRGTFAEPIGELRLEPVE